MTTHRVAGARGRSLGAQLAALGLTRVLAEQADPRTRCHFEGTDLVVETTIDSLADWLVDAYCPTPVLSPWNEGSGFGAKDKAPRVALTRLLGLASDRLDGFRRSYDAVAPLATRARADGWAKERQISEIRARCPDEMLPWMDAAVVALGQERLVYPPLLGSGGNDGRLDFSTNFHQRLLDVLPVSDKSRNRSLILAQDWLGGTNAVPQEKAPMGQFDPGAAGTPNSSPFGAADSLANPWMFVMMVEGTMLFGASPARRLDSQAQVEPRAAMTFMTFGSPVGSATGSDIEETRGEAWIPWWDRPLPYPSVRQLFSEGRAVWKGRTATQSGQMYLAAASHGVSAGISGFDRYTIVRRNGLAFSAVLADEVTVRSDSAMLIVADVEDWPNGVARRAELTGNVALPARRFLTARVNVARSAAGSSQIASIREMLAAITDLDIAVGQSGMTRSDVSPCRARPSRALRAVLGEPAWRDVCNTGEFRLALGLASTWTGPLTTAPQGRTMRELLLPIDPHEQKGRPPRWRDSPLVPGLGRRPLQAVLADVLTYLVFASQAVPDETTRTAKLVGTVGPPSAVSVPAADLHSWVCGSIDDEALEQWFRALLALDWRSKGAPISLGHSKLGEIDPTLAVLAPFRMGISPLGETNGTRYGITSEWVAQLSAGHVERAHEGARARLRQIGYDSVSRPMARAAPPRASGMLLAAALLPNSSAMAALSRVSRRLAVPPEMADSESSQSPHLEETV